MKAKNLKFGDLVRLTDKARKDFYATERNVDCFKVGGELSSKNFVEFCDHWLGFEDGRNAGYIVGVGSGKHIFKVKFFSPTGRWIESYYTRYDLEVVDA